MKLKLNLDALSVDTFDTTRSERQNGTVFGEQCTCWTACGQNTCPGCPTCDGSCNGTCAGSCDNTCVYTCDDASCAGCGTGYTACGCETHCLQTGCGVYECCA